MVVSLSLNTNTPSYAVRKKKMYQHHRLGEVSSYDTPIVHATQSACTLLLLEGIPESKSLIASTRDYDLAIRTHCEIEHTVRMTR